MKIILSKGFALRLAAASVIALVPAGASLADPGLANVPAHQHYLRTENGELVRIGPNVCDDADMQDAFNQFHNNVHNSGAQNKGPVGGAPGLDDTQGAVLEPHGCTFVVP